MLQIPSHHHQLRNESQSENANQDVSKSYQVGYSAFVGALLQVNGGGKRDDTDLPDESETDLGGQQHLSLLEVDSVLDGTAVLEQSAEVVDARSQATLSFFLLLVYALFDY